MFSHFPKVENCKNYTSPINFILIHCIHTAKLFNSLTYNITIFYHMINNLINCVFHKKTPLQFYQEDISVYMEVYHFFDSKVTYDIADKLSELKKIALDKYDNFKVK